MHRIRKQVKSNWLKVYSCIFPAMETEEIYSLSIPLPVTSKFAVEWSEDNHVSILTDKGVNIFELIPSPMSPYPTIKFSRSFIYAPQICPAEVISNKIEAGIWNMHREVLYSFMMDEALTPKLYNVKEMVPKVVALAWSPQGLILPSKCLLAILTSTGAVLVVYKITTDWYPAHDLSVIRNNSMEFEIEKILKENESNINDFDTLRKYIKALKASCFTWSKLFLGFAYLTVAYCNGDIMIYKIPQMLEYSETLHPEIAGTIKLEEYSKISTLFWITINPKKHLIITGYLDGRIRGLKIDDHDDTFELKMTEMYYNYTDRIPINATKIFPHTGHQNIKVLIAKGSFLFLLHFTHDGELKNMHHLQLAGFMISGITCISENHALVTTENKCMFSIDTQNDQLSKIKVNNTLSQEHVRYLGLAHSQSSAIFLSITSPSSTYDHLVVKEPNKIYMFGLKDKLWDSLFLLEQNKSKKFEQLWDCLEVIRMKAAKASDPSIVLQVLCRDPSSLESLSLNELRITMWISIMMEISEKKRVVQGIGSISGEISEAQPLIFIRTACNYLMHLKNKSLLLEEQKLSVYLLRTYLQVYLEKEQKETRSPLCDHVKDILNKTSQLTSINSEVCNLCGKSISNFPWKSNKCPQGHILPRCAITLLQITSINYSTCPICGLIFHSCLEQEFKETRCLLCDVPALKENRVLDLKCYIPKEKNLSKPHSYVVTEDKDVETMTDEP